MKGTRKRGLLILFLVGVIVVLTSLILSRPPAPPAHPETRPKHVHWAPGVKPPNPPIRPQTWQPYPPSTYTRIGYLEGETGTRPLLGRRSHTRRHRWHYSSTNDPNNDINALRLPVTKGQRKCTEEMGCDELLDGDVVTLPGSTSPMTVRLYERHFG